MNRRQFLIKSGGLVSMALASSLLPGCLSQPGGSDKKLFELSLAQWSLHRQLRSGELKVLDFPVKTREAFDIGAVEYVNQFFMDRAEDRHFLGEMKTRASDNGVQSLLIMVDAEGDLGDPDSALRQRAVENHYKWVTAAEYLGCHSIRVNASGRGSREDVQAASVDGLRQLSQFARDYDINVIVENHGGYSSDGLWLAQVLASVDLPNCGSLPDFGNFGDYDRYLGVRQLMPYARGISAKSFEFDADGNEINTDFVRMLQIIRDAGYQGHIGIEFEGEGDEDLGVLATKKLLQKAERLLV
ncbi:Sugar phosphate isomerase/epimerase [Microbulbifer donghaiensis]|uniref:Sugar phosphate isomerase/epimerase n=1 Tax=Microbulbifer donghaiensis TaxID=494016 RepID=A0A1M5I3J4_9GAMM|nr:sugar phosphate isomerase/epimerase family protein [Microbulbifer donghaiensis]SHG22707.1 Sugar phosphate isomerase/epimerase [Microbulbifer donghaiensis]